MTHREPRLATETMIELPTTALALLIGAAGSGKSTFASRHFAPQQILSSDAFRELVAGDAADQSATSDAFRLLHQVAGSRLRRGLLTVVDATNVLHSARAPLLAMAGLHGRPSFAIVFKVPLVECLRRNGNRPGRVVPEAVVRRHVALLGRAIPHLAGEGFESIVFLDAAQAATVRIA